MGGELCVNFIVVNCDSALVTKTTSASGSRKERNPSTTSKQWSKLIKSYHPFQCDLANWWLEGTADAVVHLLWNSDIQIVEAETNL